MSFWSLYNQITGEIGPIIQDANGPLDDLQPGQLFIAGAHDTRVKYIIGGQVVNRPVFPVIISNNEEPYSTGKFRLDVVPAGTVISYDETTITVSDGYFELTSLVDGTVPVTLMLFPYLPRTIDAIFTT